MSERLWNHAFRNDRGPIWEEAMAEQDRMSKKSRSELSVALRRFGDEILENKKRAGWTITTPAHWEDENQIPADLALIHSEVSEALEAFRKGDKEGFAEELADIFIRVVGLAHGLEIDLGEGVEAKNEKNRQRAYRHGGKKL